MKKLKKVKAPSTLEDRLKSRLNLVKSGNLLIGKEGVLRKADDPLALNSEKNHSFNGQSLLKDQHADDTWADHHPELFHGLQTHLNMNDIERPHRTTRYMHIAGFADKDDQTVIKSPLDYSELKLSHEDNPPKPSTRSSHYSFMLHPDFRTSHREAAFHKLATDVFGLGAFVPKTTVFRHPVTGDPWSAQEKIKSFTHFSASARGQLGKFEDSGDLHKMAIMESILGHNDRNGSNVLVDDRGMPKLVDNAFAFDYSHRYGTPIPTYASHLLRGQIPERVHQWIQGLDGAKMKKHMQNMKAPGPIIQMAMKRLDEAKRWSRYTTGNPHFAQDFGGALEAIQAHRFNRIGAPPINSSEVKRGVYNRIKRGHPYATHPDDSDKTYVLENL